MPTSDMMILNENSEDPRFQTRESATALPCCQPQYVPGRAGRLQPNVHFHFLHSVSREQADQVNKILVGP